MILQGFLSGANHRQYEIVRPLGSGGSGDVYYVYERQKKQYYAAKFIPNTSISDGMAEAEFLKKLHHPALPKLYECIPLEEGVVLVMEYIEGKTLVEYRQNCENTFSTYNRSQKYKLHLFFLLADVLSYLHEQEPPVIYRDLKPENIMVEQNGQIRLIDFGTARHFQVSEGHDTVPLGTPGYAAPEQMYGNAQTDQRTDIYALGATMYYLYTGQDLSKPPYRIQLSVKSNNPEIPTYIYDCMKRCLQPSPEDRYQNIGELLEDLEWGENPNKDRYQSYRPIHLVSTHSQIRL
ncbi:MAG: serine/threonine protein kinase [Lachnospiraceae bacterium]|nr:serine/threonine protein kinase [Lachnospiraceae bacterium]